MVDYASDGSVIGVEVLDATAVEIDGQKVPAPVPAVDREAVARLIDDEINAVHNANQAPDADGEDLRSEGEIAADALLARGLVTTGQAQTVTTEQIDKARIALLDVLGQFDAIVALGSIGGTQELCEQAARTVAKAFGLPVEEEGQGAR